MNSGYTYKKAGVNIDAGNELVERIKPLAKSTSRKGVNVSLGGFGALFDLKQCNFKDPVLVSSTDGVGTKLKIAQETGKHDTIGIDLVAMSVNDIVVQGAEPLFFLDYFACGKLDVNIAEKVIAGISEGCLKAGCALIGGETAEMPDMYPVGEYDLAGFAVGAVERDAVLPRKNIAEGDVVIGFQSSGVHSNGYSLVRRIIKDNGLSFESKPAELSASIAEIALAPTRIYVKSCLALLRKLEVKAFAHITGGGITENFPRVLPEGLSAEIDLASWKMPEIFSWLMKLGNIEQSEMLRTFNCGIGMIAVIAESDKNLALQTLSEAGEDAFVIGRIKKGENINYINSLLG